MRQGLTHAIAVALGIAVGSIWQTGAELPFFSNTPVASDDSLPAEPIVNVDASERTSTSAPIASTPADLDVATPLISKSPEVNSSAIDNYIDSLQESSAPNIAVSADLRSALEGAHIGMVESGEIDLIADEINALIKRSDNPAQEVFNYLASDMDDDTKHVLEWVIASRHHEGLADSIVQGLAVANESDYEGWETILNLARIDTSTARESLFTVLPNIQDDSVVTASLHSILPMVLSPEERAQTLASVSTYTDSSNEEVRSAAIAVLGQWSAHDYMHVMSNTLENGTDLEKQATLYAIAEGRLQSDELKNQLNNILNDESIGLDLKLDAFHSLSFYSLSEQEYSDYYRFYQMYVVPMEQSMNGG